MENVDLTFVLIYFVYGLAFFSMGLTTIMEAIRSPSVQAARILRPLAVFGFVHGLHEWLEMISYLIDGVGGLVPETWNLLRISMLAFSFASLIGYGVQVLSPPNRLAAKDLFVGSAMLGLYGISLLVIGAVPTTSNTEWVVPAEFMSRYILATPGAIIASLALNHQARRFIIDGREPLSRNLRWASIGFGLYGVTQFLGPLTGAISELYLQSNSFSNLLLYPLPAIRAILAVIVTISLIRMTQTLELERRQALHQAQLDRVEALEALQNELHKRHELRRQLLRKTVTMQEEERSRISRELHDETAQLLTGFNANLAALKNLESKNGKSSAVLDRLKQLSSQMSDSIHRLVSDLRPAQLDKLGIHSALKHLVDSSELNLGLTINYNFNRECNQLDPLAGTVIFRVVQEALTNVAKHAETKKAEVKLIVHKDFIQVSVCDEGKGFDSQEQNQKLGFGLLGLDERVRAMGGSFQIKSQRAVGTEIIANFPLDALCGEEENESV